MKLIEVLILASAIIVGCLVGIAYAQSTVPSALTLSAGGTLSGCPTPTAKALIACNVAGDPANPDGEYISANGAAYFLVPAAMQAVVTTFNGRKGAVVPASGDYTFAQIGGTATAAQLPATITCTVSQTITATAQTVSLSGCH